MDKNTQHLILSELYSATGYLERLNFAMEEVYKSTALPQIKELKEGSKKSLLIFIERELFQKQFHSTNSSVKDLSVEEVILLSRNILETLIKFQLESNASLEVSVNFINLIYSLCHPIHKMASHYGNLDIQYPRSSLLETTVEEYTISIDYSEEVKKFVLKKESILASQDQQVSSISSLQWQRDKKSKEFIRLGHEAIFKQDHSAALESFKKALNYIESAETLTLIGWTHSLMGENENAKSYCLKAIQKDPDYGPPYNDMGTYLMDQNHLKESLKWFELAKKCSNYQNKEYPYINAGRVYMALNQYSKALDEFSMALTLAPNHEELHATVTKLQESIKKKSNFNNIYADEEQRPPIS